MGLFDFAKKLNVLPQTTTNNENRKILFSNEFMIMGIDYPCHKNKKKMRADVINKTFLNSPVHIEPCFYKQKPGYMIVNTRLKLDLGVLSENAAAWLANYYSQGTTEVTLVNKRSNSFLVNVVVFK